MPGGIYAAGHRAISPGGPGARHSLPTQPGPQTIWIAFAYRGTTGVAVTSAHDLPSTTPRLPAWAADRPPRPLGDRLAGLARSDAVVRANRSARRSRCRGRAPRAVAPGPGHPGHPAWDHLAGAIQAAQYLPHLTGQRGGAESFMKVGSEARADMTAYLRRTANECFSRLSEHLLAAPDVGQGPGSGSN